MSTFRLSLSRDSQGMLLARDDFAGADFEAPWRYERVGGRLLVMSPAGDEHTHCSETIRDHLGRYRLEHPQTVHRVVSEAWITIDGETDRIADIAVYLASGQGRIPRRIPELVFEIVSDGDDNVRRDYEEKRADYERRGVREYVIVDRFDRRLTVLRLAGGTYVETILGPQDTYVTPLLPGLEIPLAGIL